MAIVQTLDSFSSFYDAIFESRKDQFTYAAWETIYNYLDSLSEEIGNPIEFDCVAICCEYNEYSMEDFLSQYPDAIDSDDLEGMDDNETLEAIRDYLDDNTTVLSCEEGSIVFVAF